MSQDEIRMIVKLRMGHGLTDGVVGLRFRVGVELKD